MNEDEQKEWERANLGLGLGETLSIAFSRKGILETFKPLFPTVSDGKLLQEMAILNLTSLTFALMSSFNASDEGAMVAQDLNQVFGKFLVEQGIFKDQLHYVGFVRSRVREYESEWNKQNQPEKIPKSMHVARRAVENISKDEQERNSYNLLFLTDYFIKLLKTDEKFLDKIVTES